MSEFLKCNCPHCGQPIEYPSKGTGETVQCPTCEKSVTLTPTIQPQASDEAQRKKEWDEWVALNERLKERRIQSGIPPSQEQAESLREDILLPIEPSPVLEKKKIKTRLRNLTEETIRKATTTGDTPLHRAAKIGQIYEIPKHLLKAELFLVKNLDWQKLPNQTALHVTIGQQRKNK